MAKTHDGKGCWLVTSTADLNYRDAAFHGSIGGHPLNAPIVGMAPTPDGDGCWEVATDGGIFSFGAPRSTAPGRPPLNNPIVGTAEHDGTGRWLVASDEGIFAYGDTSFHGLAGSLPLNTSSRRHGLDVRRRSGTGWGRPTAGSSITAMPASSSAAPALNRPIVGMAVSADGRGYWLTASNGSIFICQAMPRSSAPWGATTEPAVVGVASSASGRIGAGSSNTMGAPNCNRRDFARDLDRSD